MNVYGYARVSTSEQASDGSSLDTQQRQIEAWSTLKGWTVSSVFVEAGVSGSIPLSERPEGARLLAAVNEGDAVITPKLDRMFRSASDALSTLDVLKADGVALHMIDLGGDVCGNGISKLVFTILLAVAENERERIRERIRDVKRHQASKGEYLGGKVPFGMRLIDGLNGKKQLAVNLEEMDLLKKINTMREDGASLREIGAKIGKHPESVKRILNGIVKKRSVDGKWSTAVMIS